MNFEYKNALSEITNCLDSFYKFVSGFTLADNTDQLLDINKITQVAFDDFVADAKYLSYDKLAGAVKDVANLADKLSKESFINNKAIIERAKSELDNFVELLMQIQSISDENDGKIAIRDFSETDERKSKLDFMLTPYSYFDGITAGYHISTNFLNNLAQFIGEDIEVFAYENPILSHFDYVKDIASSNYSLLENKDTEWLKESIHEQMKEKLCVAVEEYGVEHLPTASFVASYFSSDKEIRNIYRSTLITACEMRYNAELNEYNTQNNTQKGKVCRSN